MSKKARGKKVRAKKARSNYGKQEANTFRDTVTVSAKTAGQKRYIQEVNSNDIIFCTGPAGTGKTAVAVGMALQSIMDPSSGIEQIIIMRPVRGACDENIGFIPGSVELKMAPWAAPVIDNMKVFVDHRHIVNLFSQNKIEIIPLSYARGRSLNKAFVIVDESQNMSSEQFLMVLTRIGDGSKMVLNGDISQSDHPGEGLTDAMDRLSGLDGISMVEMDSSDIVRNPIIAQIISRYSDI